jgi:DNA-directed RNA polymerase specialized sigma24 family protein
VRPVRSAVPAILDLRQDEQVGNVTEKPSGATGGPGVSQETVRQIALRVVGRRMFSDLADGERAELVQVGVDAFTHAWGPRGRPVDVEAWLARGLYAAMMESYRQSRMLRPRRSGAPADLQALLEHWLAAEPALAVPITGVDDALTDRYLRGLGAADARLLWLQSTGFTRDEIADLLGIRPSAVSVRLHRLRVRLRETVESMSELSTEGVPGSVAGPAGTNDRDSGHGAA